MKENTADVPSGEQVRIRRFRVWAVNQTTGQPMGMDATDWHYPLHLTAHGRITAIDNTLGTALTVQQGNNRLLGTFTITGRAATGSTLTLDTMALLLEASGVELSNIRMGGINELQQGSCSTETTDSYPQIVCNVPSTLNDISVQPVTLNVYANVMLSTGMQTGTLRLRTGASLGLDGGGGISWRDDGGTFNWVEEDIHQENGPVVTVTK